MGIYDREYYRREGPSFLGSFANRGQVCKFLIVANIVLFVIQLLTQRVTEVTLDGERFRLVSSPVTDALEFNARLVLHGQVWRLLTYAFLHDPSNIWHIVFNMLFLWWFGHDVEDLYGPREFLAFYLVAAGVGSLANLVAWQGALAGARCIGASGAVTAVMVLYALHYPMRVIYVWFVLPVPIWLFVLFEVAMDSLIFVGQVKTSTAVTVHLGGAAFALAYAKMHWRVLNMVPDLRGWWRQRSQPRLRVYHGEEASARMPAAVPPAADVDEQLEAKVDAVLEKVARFGQGSLTESERQILLRASEAYKKRRT